jgi:hypothetical protein
LLNSCTTPTGLAALTTFNYAPGATSFGISLSNFPSVNPLSPQFAITNHELFVNGVDLGVLETLAGANWSPGIVRNAYLRVDATGGSTITSVGFQTSRPLAPSTSLHLIGSLFSKAQAFQNPVPSGCLFVAPHWWACGCSGSRDSSGQSGAGKPCSTVEDVPCPSRSHSQRLITRRCRPRRAHEARDSSLTGCCIWSSSPSVHIELLM